MRNRLLLTIVATASIWVCSPATAHAQEAPPHKWTAQEVAEALVDPAATIMYFNVSYRNYRDVGPRDDTNQEYRLNGAGFFNLPNGSSVFYRAFLPFYDNEFPVDDSGVGDALLSAYWVPKKGSFILGYGAALIAPTASEDWFGTGKWSAGPTIVIAKKEPGVYTVGGLVTHVWSFAGESDRSNVSMTTIQPALTYFLNKKGTSVSVTSETTYNWEADTDPWQIPLTAAIGQVLPPFGKFFMAVGLGGSYYIVKSDFAPEWDLRAVVSIVFP
ncbi:MAG: hypothetical protein ACM3MD_03730 [Betaproteobacteria bacterium]